MLDAYDVWSLLDSSPPRLPGTPEATAAHEAGHAVAAHRLGFQVNVIVLEPIGDCSGYVLYGPRGSTAGTLTREQRALIFKWKEAAGPVRVARRLAKLAQEGPNTGRSAAGLAARDVLVAMAGPVTEAGVRGEYDWRGARDDVEAAALALAECVPGEEFAAVWRVALRTAVRMAARHTIEVEAVTAALLELGELDGKKFRTIVDQHAGSPGVVDLARELATRVRRAVRKGGCRRGASSLRGVKGGVALPPIRTTAR
jgi:hypothetical protein